MSRGSMLEVTGELDSALRPLVRAWLAQRQAANHRRDGRLLGEAEGDAAIRVTAVEVLRPGRPGILDVVAEVGDRAGHAVLGLHRIGEEPHQLRPGEEAVLGFFTDAEGTAIVVDALYDADLAPLVLQAVLGDRHRAAFEVVAEDDLGTVVVFEDRCLTVLTWLADGPHPAVEVLVALDEVGFNHLAAPLSVWRRAGKNGKV